MSVNTRNQVAYGLSQSLLNVFQPPIVSKRDPNGNDKAPIGTVWCNTVSQDVFILSAISQNQAAWSSITGGGAFTTITASGNITSTGGDIEATVGDVIAGNDVTAGNDITAVGSITAGTGITSTTGNISTATGDIVSGNDLQVAGDITSVAGDVLVTLGSVFATTIRARGDAVGSVGATTMSNVVNTTQGAGTATIFSTTANPITNTGFLKFYVGATAVFVPYFDTIA